MSLSKEYQEYHLTLKGWVKGSFQADFLGSSENVVTPDDRFLTIHCYDEQASVYSKSIYYEEKIWESDDKNQIKKLKQRYGEKPDWFGYKMMK